MKTNDQQFEDTAIFDWAGGECNIVVEVVEVFRDGGEVVDVDWVPLSMNGDDVTLNLTMADTERIALNALRFAADRPVAA